MIVFTCPNCHSRLQAKPGLAGHVRKCPRCATPVTIVADEADATSVADPNAIPVDDALPGQEVVPATEEHLPTRRLLERLNREYHYMICDREHLVATWANNGNGWMLRSGTSSLPAKRNRDKLPTGGDFQLVELKIAMMPEGKRLSGIRVYQLASRWALTVLDQTDDAIVEKIDGPGHLNREQKNAVRQAMKEQFMRPVWEQSTDAMEYLANMDFHSPGAG